MTKDLVGTTGIEARIVVLRGHRVMLDADIAAIYGVPTKQLNQQVKRHRSRFPPDFMFRLTVAEKAEVVTKCDHLKRLKFSPVLPLAFTEHGTLMLANVLRSPRAVDMSIEVVRAFVRIREAVTGHRDFAAKINALERRYDRRFKMVFAAIRALMDPPKKSHRRIGFRSKFLNR